MKCFHKITISRHLFRIHGQLRPRKEARHPLVGHKPLLQPGSGQKRSPTFKNLELENMRYMALVVRSTLSKLQCVCAES